MIKKPVVSIITVNYFSSNLVKKLAKTLPPKKDFNAEFIVVDNSVNRGEAKKLANISNIDQLIVASNNVGFGAANNLAVHRAHSEYLLFLNPDTVLTKVDSIQSLLNVAKENKGLGIIGPRIISPDGSLQRSAHKNMAGILGHVYDYTPIIIFVLSRIGLEFHPTLYSTTDHNNLQHASHVLGACMMMSTYVFKDLGGFDEDFFLYREETDLAGRVKAAGYEIIYYPGSTIEHVSGGSTKNSDYASLNHLYIKSVYLFFCKNRGRMYAGFAWTLAVLGLSISNIVFIMLQPLALILRKKGFALEICAIYQALTYHVLCVPRQIWNYRRQSEAALSI